jgi:hypothetical protein
LSQGFFCVLVALAMRPGRAKSVRAWLPV